MRMKYEMESHETDPAGCRTLQESTLTEIVLTKTRLVANLLNAFYFRRVFFFHFYFLFEKAGKTKEAHLEHLRISTREPLKQTVANLSLYPAPQASEHRLDRLSASSVYYFADERSKNTFL